MDRIFAECRRGDSDLVERKRRTRQTMSESQMKDHSTDSPEGLVAEISAGKGS